MLPSTVHAVNAGARLRPISPLQQAHSCRARPLASVLRSLMLVREYDATQKEQSKNNSTPKKQDKTPNPRKKC